MRGRWFLLIAGLLAAAFAIGAVACGKDYKGGAKATATQPAAGAAPTDTAEAAATATAVEVKLTEYIVSPDPDAVPAGSVTFNASNIGGEDHQLYVIRTDLAPDALPAADDGSVDEAGEGIEVLGEIEKFAAGGEESLTVDLQPGAYVLICNIVTAEGTSHYQKGMHAAFTVTE